MTRLRNELEILELVQYEEKFVDEGFDTWEILCEITESDFEKLGVKLGHRRKLLRAINDSRLHRAASHPASYRPSNISHLAPEGITSAAGASAAAPAPADVPDQESKYPALHDSSSIGRPKRSYKRHPRPDDNAPRKPPTAYMMFSSDQTPSLRQSNPELWDFSKRAKVIGERWSSLTAEAKGPYEQQASEAKANWNAAMTQYRQTNNHQRYEDYLVSFRELNPSEGKKKKVETETRGDTPSSNELVEWPPTLNCRRSSLGQDLHTLTQTPSSPSGSLPSGAASPRPQENYTTASLPPAFKDHPNATSNAARYYSGWSESREARLDLRQTANLSAVSASHSPSYPAVSSFRDFQDPHVFQNRRESRQPLSQAGYSPADTTPSMEISLASEYFGPGALIESIPSHPHRVLPPLRSPAGALPSALEHGAPPTPPNQNQSQKQPQSQDSELESQRNHQEASGGAHGRDKKRKPANKRRS